MEQESVRHHPDHSFIWLGGLRTLVLVRWWAVIAALWGSAAPGSELGE